MMNLIGLYSSRAGVSSVWIVGIHPIANGLLCLADTIVGFQIGLVILKTAPVEHDKDTVRPC